MGRGRTRRVLTRRVEKATDERFPDELIVEEPLSIRLDDTLVATTMRTPGHDFELAVGFCHAEGYLDAIPVTGVRYCGTGPAADTEFNIVSVDTGHRAPAPTPRLGPTSSSCGICGAESIDALRERLHPLTDADPLPVEVIAAVPERVREGQELFDRTGSVHAAAAIDRTGAPLVIREDIGRHNAVDKVVGHLLLDDALPAHGLGLFISGRASFEMVQKAWAAGFATIVAVSGPSALAAQTARAAGITLTGFVRDGAFNVYSPKP